MPFQLVVKLSSPKTRKGTQRVIRANMPFKVLAHAVCVISDDFGHKPKKR